MTSPLTPEELRELRELARNADREVRKAIGAALRQGAHHRPDISEGVRAAGRFQKAATPQVVAALVDKIEQQAERIRELEGLVADPWVDGVGPDLRGGMGCGWCLAEVGQPHGQGCRWAAAMQPKENHQ